MIFRSITLENIFCYRGSHRLDLTRDPGAQGNIVLVIGRNGYGKTSLLNAVKLLFLGSDTKEQRQVGFPPANLGRNQYVLGVPGRWDGIMNRRARENDDATFSAVRIEMEDDGRQIVAERRFSFKMAPFYEGVTLSINGRPVADAAAEQRLAELLPRELVPYFFFDGEEIQFLAEASNADRTAAMERLLRLRFMTGVEEAVNSLVGEWQRAELPGDVKKRIVELEHNIAIRLADSECLTERNREIELRLRDLADDSRAYAKRMETLQAASPRTPQALQDEIDRLSKDLQEMQSVLSRELATDAPLLANPSLVTAACQALQQAVEAKSQARAATLDEVFKVLPDRLFEERPHPSVPLADHQKRFYKQKIQRILDTYAVVDPGPGRLLEAIDLPLARQMLERMTTAEVTGAGRRQDRARRLREASALAKRLDKLKEEQRSLQFQRPQSPSAKFSISDKGVAA